MSFGAFYIFYWNITGKIDLFLFLWQNGNDCIQIGEGEAPVPIKV